MPIKRNVVSKKHAPLSLPMAQQKEDTADFLCMYCRSVMCTDCQSIAEEYERLHTHVANQLYWAEKRVKEAEEEAALQKQLADDRSYIMRLGMPATIKAFYDAMATPKLRALIERAAKKYASEVEGSDAS